MHRIGYSEHTGCASAVTKQQQMLLTVFAWHIAACIVEEFLCLCLQALLPATMYLLIQCNHGCEYLQQPTCITGMTWGIKQYSAKHSRNTRGLYL